MDGRPNTFTTLATAVLLGGITLAQQPQPSNGSGQTLAMDDMMKQCVEHCRTAGGEQAGSQADGGKRSMGCMAMMGMENMKGMPEMQNMPAMKGMPGMASEARQDAPAAVSTRQSPKMATSLRELERVCGQKLDPRTTPKSTYKGKTYYFCSDDDKTQFDGNAEQFVGERSLQEPRAEGRQTRRRRC